MERTGIKVNNQINIGKYWYNTLKIRFSIIIWEYYFQSK